MAKEIARYYRVGNADFWQIALYEDKNGKKYCMMETFKNPGEFSKMRVHMDIIPIRLEQGLFVREEDLSENDKKNLEWNKTQAAKERWKEMQDAKKS